MIEVPEMQVMSAASNTCKVQWNVSTMIACDQSVHDHAKRVSITQSVSVTQRVSIIRYHN